MEPSQPHLQTEGIRVSILRCSFWRSYAKEQAFAALLFLYQMNFTHTHKFLSVVFSLPYVPLVFPSHFIHLLFHVGLASISLLKTSPLCLFLSFMWDNEEERHSFWSYRENILVLTGVLPFSGLPKLGMVLYFVLSRTGFFSLLLTENWQKTFLKFHCQLLARNFRDMYFLKINNPLV